MKDAVNAQLLGCLFGVSDISRGLKKDKKYNMLYKLIQEKSGEFEKTWNLNLERLPELNKFAQEAV